MDSGSLAVAGFANVSSLPCDLFQEVVQSRSTRSKLDVAPAQLQRYAFHGHPCLHEADSRSSFNMTARSPTEALADSSRRPERHRVAWLECDDVPDVPALTGPPGDTISWHFFAIHADKYVNCRHHYRAFHCDGMHFVNHLAEALMANIVIQTLVDDNYQEKFAKALKGEAHPDILNGICYYGIVAGLFVRGLHHYDLFPAAAYGMVNTALELLGGPTLSLDFLDSTESWSWLHGALVENTVEWMHWGKARENVFRDGFIIISSLRHQFRTAPPASELGLSPEDPICERPAPVHTNAEVFLGLGAHFGFAIQLASLVLTALPHAVDGTARVRLIGSAEDVDGPSGGASWNSALMCKYIGFCSKLDTIPEANELNEAQNIFTLKDRTEGYFVGLRAMKSLGNKFPELHDCIFVSGDEFLLLMASMIFPNARLLMWLPLTPFLSRILEHLQTPLNDVEVFQIFLFKEVVRGKRAHLFVAGEVLEHDLMYLAGLRSEVLLAPSLFIVPFRGRPGSHVLLHGRLFLMKSLWPSILPKFAPGWNYLNMAKNIVSFEQMGELYACAYFPNGLELLGIMDLYALLIPLLVPTWTLMLKVERLITIPRRWTWPPEERFHWFFIGNETFKHPFPPFWDGSMLQVGRVAPEQFGYWWQYSHVAILPHVIEFASMPDLSLKLHTLDRASVTAAMRQTHVSMARSTVRRFAHAFTSFLK